MSKLKEMLLWIGATAGAIFAIIWAIGKKDDSIEVELTEKKAEIEVEEAEALQEVKDQTTEELASWLEQKGRE